MTIEKEIAAFPAKTSLSCSMEHSDGENSGAVQFHRLSKEASFDEALDCLWIEYARVRNIPLDETLTEDRTPPGGSGLRKAPRQE